MSEQEPEGAESLRKFAESLERLSDGVRAAISQTDEMISFLTDDGDADCRRIARKPQVTRDCMLRLGHASAAAAAELQAALDRNG